MTKANMLNIIKVVSFFFFEDQATKSESELPMSLALGISLIMVCIMPGRYTVNVLLQLCHLVTESIKKDMIGTGNIFDYQM